MEKGINEWINDYSKSVFFDYQSQMKLDILLI